MDELSRELLKANPESISVKGTRASVLIDLGRLEEGQAMLNEVLEKTEATIDKTYANIFLALGAKQQGKLDLSREYAEKAAKIDPTCPALKRVSDFLPSSS
jgi:predicted Zn-dependent protease